MCPTTPATPNPVLYASLLVYQASALYIATTGRYLLRTLPTSKAQPHCKGRASAGRAVDSNFAAMLVDLLQNESFVCGESWLLCHCRILLVYSCICSMHDMA